MERYLDLIYMYSASTSQARAAIDQEIVIPQSYCKTDSTPNPNWLILGIRKGGGGNVIFFRSAVVSIVLISLM